MTQKKDEGLKSFQIGNLNPSFPGGMPPKPSTPAVSPSGKPAGAHTTQAPTDPADRVFPNLEQLIETEEIEEIGKQMGETCKQLDELINTRSGRAKTEAQKARLAYEHTFDLIDHLMQLKQQMLNPPSEG